MFVNYGASVYCYGIKVGYLRDYNIWIFDVVLCFEEKNERIMVSSDCFQFPQLMWLLNHEFERLFPNNYFADLRAIGNDNVW